MNRMSYRGYSTAMTFDPDDKIIVGRVLDVDDIITFHSESVANFEANFHVVIDDYIAACETLGGAPEKPASGKLMLRVAPSVHAAAIRAATRKGMSLNKWAEEVLQSASRAGSRPSPTRRDPSTAPERSAARRRPRRAA